MTTAPAYDLLLTGGTLLDPAQGTHQRRDIAFKDGLVAEVAERIDAAASAVSVDVTGKLITPGLIDLHGHFYHGRNPWPLNTPTNTSLKKSTACCPPRGSSI